MLKIRIINPLGIIDTNINDIYKNKNTDSFLKTIKNDLNVLIEYLKDITINEMEIYKTKTTTFIIWSE